MPKKSRGKVIETGQFVSGTKWMRYDKVRHKGKTYDTKTEYVWEDPDFPQQEDIDNAIEDARKHDEKEPSKYEIFEGYIDWQKQTHRFRCSGFLKYDGSVDCLPKDSSLGRISVETLTKVKQREKK